MKRRLLLIALPVTLSLAWVSAEAYYADRVGPGVVVQGVPLGGMSAEEARRSLEAHQADLTAPQVTVRVGAREQVLDARELGWTVDTEATVSRALEVGRGGVGERLQAQLGLQGEPRAVEPVARVDEARLRDRLQALGRDLEQPATNARVFFVDGRYAIRNDRPGSVADIEAAVQAYRTSPMLTRLELKAVARPATLRAEDLMPRVREANALLRPFKLIYPLRTEGGAERVKSVTLTPAQVANLFWVRADRLEPDHKTLQQAVVRASAFDRAPENASFRFAGGKLVPVAEKNGWKLDQAEARRLFERAVFDPKVSSVRLPVETVKPSVTLADLPDPDELQLISEATTRFKGSSAARSTNVVVAARALDGTLVAQGEVFSFNDAIGEISPENGYAGALIISGGRTVEGVGGGVCQVSTTAFRALYQAGLPVVERNQHAYRVSWYEPYVGFEAAVYQPGVDLKMKNDLAGPMLVRAKVDRAAGTVTVQVWGMPVKRTVKVSQPTILSRTPHPAPRYVSDPSLPSGVRKQVDWAVDGYRVRITRTIVDASGKRTEELNSNYRPWQAVYLVGSR
ncbi:vancomycin resistance protein YoaR [Deinobacterium chartae]|uniref:Vancomycin resistance protein YoaR n=1 Tax=Deinobacterium chartae TaxID=521158 RepID=A0A841HUQ2_9DEIO|nr:VanW family protein [Deinobacterium chartae]MBB6097191.1 vancomycin resistance protein YoaR [Deinobacterium chartae]